MGRKKLTTKEIKERIFKLVGDEYELLSEYVGAKTKVKIKHNVCNFEYMVCWNDFQQGNRCPKCAILAHKNKLAFTNENIVKAMYELVGNEYTKLDDSYINALTKFRIRHEKCNFEYMVCWNNFQRGVRCPKCSFSKGEKFIEGYLTNHNISFATQVRFSDCRYKRPLPFDFGILNKEKKVIALIEYDGEGHFIPVEYWGGKEKLEITQLRDSIKDNFCKKNKIPLLRIRFDEDIEQKLSLFLAQERVKV